VDDDIGEVSSMENVCQNLHVEPRKGIQAEHIDKICEIVGLELGDEYGHTYSLGKRAMGRSPSHVYSCASLHSYRSKLNEGGRNSFLEMDEGDHSQATDRSDHSQAMGE